MAQIPLRTLNKRGFDLKFSKSGNFVKITDGKRIYERKIYKKDTEDAFVVFKE